jgi:hypothetical protein
MVEGLIKVLEQLFVDDRLARVSKPFAMSEVLIVKDRERAVPTLVPIDVIICRTALVYTLLPV